MNKPRTSKARARAQSKELTITGRRLNTLALRVAGLTLDEIAAEHGVSFTTAYRDLEAASKRLDAVEKHQVDHLRRIEVRRLDAWQHSLDRKLKAGNIRAIECALKIVKLRAEITGLLSGEAQKAMVQIGSLYITARGYGAQRAFLEETDAALVAIVQKALTDAGKGGDQARELAAELPQIMEAQYVDVTDDAPKEGLDTEN